MLCDFKRPAPPRVRYGLPRPQGNGPGTPCTGSMGTTPRALPAFLWTKSTGFPPCRPWPNTTPPSGKSPDTARQALDRLEVDELGLDMVDRQMLEAMIRHYNGGPVGLDTLAAVIGEESVTIEDVYEPYLMQIGFLTRTPRGRVVLPAAYAHLGLPVPGQPSPEQPNLSFFDN